MGFQRNTAPAENEQNKTQQINKTKTNKNNTKPKTRKPKTKQKPTHSVTDIIVPNQNRGRELPVRWAAF